MAEETWYAVIDRTTGEILSTGTVLADPMPAELEAIELAIDPQAPGPKGGRWTWDGAMRRFVEVVDQDVKRRELARLEAEAERLRRELPDFNAPLP